MVPKGSRGRDSPTGHYAAAWLAGLVPGSVVLEISNARATDIGRDAVDSSDAVPPDVEVSQNLKEVIAWRLVADMVRRHPHRLWVGQEFAEPFGPD
jgi:hypothetical protein